MIRLVQIALYSAIMFALAWALWQVLPGWTDALMDRFGVFPVFIAGIALAPIGWGLACYLNRRDSGKA